MKLQCSCGAKYVFDATPEMLQNPVKFVCPSCGLDSSEFVNQLIRQEFGGQNPPPAPSVAAAPRLKISHEEIQSVSTVAAPAAAKFCSRHRGELATEKCALCGKPICPKCLAQFGYFCSPLCKGKAEAQNLSVPVYAGRTDLVEARFWRKTGLIIGTLATIIILALGAWTWYAWFGSVPHTYFSVRFEDTDRAYHGAAQLAGANQLVFLHGGTLARYDLQTKKPIWSLELLSKQQIDGAVKMENDEDARENAGGGYQHHRNQDDIERSAKQMLQAELSLHVSGQNIWVDNAGKLTHYDWGSGKVLREISLPQRGGEVVQQGDELLLFGAQSVTHINLASGDLREEQFGPPGAATLASTENSAGGGLPGVSTDGGKSMDPQQVEAQAQNLNLPARIALPALVGNAQHEKQLEAALNDNSQRPRLKNSQAPPTGTEMFQVVPGKNDFAQFSTRLLEEHFITRLAMKAPTGKSALDSGNVSVMNETTAVNEQLNEMQRNNGGGTVTEDDSRYQVNVHLPAAAGVSDWTGEVVGPPQLFVLKTVNVIAAGKTIIVLDKSNKKLWQAALTYTVPASNRRFSENSSRFGAGPCAEHDDTLYVFDEAVLTAFDANTGNARWRLPSVGIVGLFFDDQGNVYVNTTTGNPDDIKYSKQIDISRKTEAVLFKLDAKSGKTLWTIKPDGYICYLSGNFIYTLQSYDPNPTDQDVLNDMTAVLQKPPFMDIKRIRPSDGRILWEHLQDRAPVAVRFDNNIILLVFKREVQMLKYLVL